MTESQMRVVLEIPDSLDPDAADEKYTVPLRRVLGQTGVGTIESVEQGQANTPSEFSRIITISLSDYESGLEAIASSLDDQGAPMGTVLTSYQSDGHERDVIVFGPPELDP